MRLHHVQVSMPPGGEDDARRFWVDGLGLVEVEKPEPLRGRGGCWFRAYDAQGGVLAEVHVGVEEPFAPARKAHPALLVDDLDGLRERLSDLEGVVVDDREATTFPGYRRLHLGDPFGNRVEVLEEVPPR